MLNYIFKDSNVCSSAVLWITCNVAGISTSPVPFSLSLSSKIALLLFNYLDLLNDARPDHIILFHTHSQCRPTIFYYVTNSVQTNVGLRLQSSQHYSTCHLIKRCIKSAEDRAVLAWNHIFINSFKWLEPLHSASSLKLTVSNHWVKMDALIFMAQGCLYPWLLMVELCHEQQLRGLWLEQAAPCTAPIGCFNKYTCLITYKAPPSCTMEGEPKGGYMGIWSQCAVLQAHCFQPSYTAGCICGAWILCFIWSFWISALLSNTTI